jgi:hypothetical protein
MDGPPVIAIVIVAGYGGDGVLRALRHADQVRQTP